MRCCLLINYKSLASWIVRHELQVIKLDAGIVLPLSKPLSELLSDGLQKVFLRTALYSVYGFVPLQLVQPYWRPIMMSLDSQPPHSLRHLGVLMKAKWILDCGKTR